MRHRKDGRQFGRNTPHRRAMFRNLVGNLFTHERIVTTDAKAKELRRVADRLISKAKRLGPVSFTPQSGLSEGDKAKRLHVQRQLASYLPPFGIERDGVTKRNLVDKVMVDFAKRFADRPGGYTRTIKIGNRRGDNAAMSIIELVDAPSVEELRAEAPDEAAGEEASEEEASTTAAAASDDAKAKGAKAKDAKAKDAKAKDAKAKDAKPKDAKAKDGKAKDGKAKDAKAKDAKAKDKDAKAKDAK